MRNLKSLVVGLGLTAVLAAFSVQPANACGTYKDGLMPPSAPANGAIASLVANTEDMTRIQRNKYIRALPAAQQEQLRNELRALPAEERKHFTKKLRVSKKKRAAAKAQKAAAPGQ